MQYAYKLEGVDSEWIFSGNETMQDMASLAPGKYKMLIKEGVIMGFGLIYQR